MNKEFKVFSTDTIQYVSFHDCNCLRLYYTDEKLVFEMEWMEVLAEHPMNPYEQAHQSGEGKVVLQSPVLSRCELYRENEDKFEVYLLENIDFCDVELLQVEETESNGMFTLKIYLSFNNNDEYDFASIEIEYKKSYVMWNELRDLSWFEDDKWKQ